MNMLLRHQKLLSHTQSKGRLEFREKKPPKRRRQMDDVSNIASATDGHKVMCHFRFLAHVLYSSSPSEFCFTAAKASLVTILNRSASAANMLQMAVPRCLGASVPRCRGASVPRCLGASVPRCLGAPVPRCPGASVPRCLGASVPRCCGLS